MDYNDGRRTGAWVSYTLTDEIELIKAYKIIDLELHERKEKKTTLRGKNTFHLETGMRMSKA